MNVTTDRPEGVEDVWVTVQCRMLPSVIVGCLYRHPKALAQSFDYISNVLQCISLRDKPFYVLGDFNDNFMHANSKVKQIVLNAQLTQLINKPTRITPTSATLLDIAATNKPESALVADSIPCHVGDHELITVTVDLKKPKPQPSIKTFRQLKNYSPEKFRCLLNDEIHNLNIIFTTDNVDTQVHIFNEIFTKCLDSCAPIVTKELTRPFAPWITDDLKALMQERNNVQQNLKRDRNNLSLQDRYKTLKKQVRKILRQTKSEYYNNKLEENRGDSATTWSILRELVPNNKNKSNPISTKDESEILRKVEEYNTFFANVGKSTFEKSQQNVRSSETTPLRDNNHRCCPNASTKFRPQPVDNDTIILAIKHMKNTHSFGSDKIPLRFIRDALPIIITYLTCIFNTSVVTGVMPTAWKHSIIVPIFKSGDADVPSNYRPISLLPILSKILEKIITSQLTQYLESQQLLSNTQHGFRRSLSTETALQTLTNKLFDNIDKHKISLITLCDLSKAFDSVSHDILIKKFSNLNIDSYWFHSYLGGRTQSVRLGNYMSEKCNIAYGVPQGSVLGPILFLIYVNDLSLTTTDCLVIQYADDTQFIHTGTIENIQDLIKKSETTLSKIKEYFHLNGLMLNTSKTQCMFVGSRFHIAQIPRDTCIQVDNTSIVPSTSIKNLGVYFDSYMQFDTHITHICKKSVGNIMFINRIKDNFSKGARIIVIQSLVLSIMNYCIKIWGSTCLTQLQRVQKVQNFAAKVALGGAKYDHVTPFLRELKWLRVKDKYTYELGLSVYNIINKNVPSWLSSLPTRGETRSRNTRQEHQLHVPSTRTHMAARSLLVSGPVLWNSLPDSIRNSKSLPTFKKELKNYLLSI